MALPRPRDWLFRWCRRADKSWEGQASSPRGDHAFGLRAYEVEALDPNNFAHRNSVFEVRVTGGGSSDPQIVRGLLAGVLFGVATASEVVAATQVVTLEDRTTGVLEGRQVLVELEPVYGASLVLLAGSLEWHQ